MSVYVKIRNIGPGNENLLLKGVIIRKQEPRVVQLKKDSSERCVWSFTLRDTPSDMINVNLWGSADYVKNLSSRFHVGDIVDVLNVKAVFRKVSDRDDCFQPAVTSSFSITFSENQSDMRLNTSNVDEFLPLLNIPTKPPGNFLTISDILANGQKLKGQFVNLLAAVHEMAIKRQFKSKDGRDLECRDVTLIDQTYTTLTLTIWGADLLFMSDKWIPRNTDIRVDWNEYRRAITTNTTGRTVITENPNTVKATNLKHFMTSIPFQASGKIDQIINKYMDPSVITTVMSCCGVLVKSKEGKQINEFSAVVYALLESFNIDDESEYFLVTKCMRCNWKVDPSLEICLNANCPSGTGTEPPEIDQVYDIRVTLLDHTGSLSKCKLTDTVVTKMLGYKASLFHTLQDYEKTRIKWRYLLKYCAARVVVIPIREQRMPIVTVLSLDLLTPSQYSTLVPMM